MAASEDPQSASNEMEDVQSSQVSIDEDTDPLYSQVKCSKRPLTYL